MDKRDKVILVTGATGTQGGAVAHHLLENGWTVRALTRNAKSEKAQSLNDAGAEVIEGSLDDPASLERAFDGVYGLFSVQSMEQGLEVEEKQGKLLADLAKKYGVLHTVYSSVGGADRNSGVPHFESKWNVEKHITSIDIPATVIRPVFFMDNLYWQKQLIDAGQVSRMGLNPGQPLQMIASSDIGAFAAIVFESPDQYMGKSLEIAGDDVSEDLLAEALSESKGKSIELIVPDGTGMTEDMMLMFTWFREHGYSADLGELRKIHPSLMDFRSWLKVSGL